MFFTAAFKAKARAALQQHWQTALLIALIVNLPSLLVQGIAAFTNNDLSIRAQMLVLQTSGSLNAMSALPDQFRALLSETGVLVMSGLSVLAWLITPALSMGMNHWTLERIRGQEGSVSTVFSRLGIFFKSIGLRLLIVLRVLVWMLPGLGITLLALIPGFRADSATSAIGGFGITLVYLGSVAMIVLGIMGYLYYAMADFILADEPEERIVSCLRRSREMMKNRRGFLMSLMLSFILWYLLITLAASFLSGLGGSVLGLMAEMLGSLFLSVYILTTQGVFYEALRLAPIQPMQQEPDSDPSQES